MRVLESMRRAERSASGSGVAEALGPRRWRARLHRRVVAMIATLGLVPGCAQVISRSSVEVTPRPDAAALVVGPPGGEITSRGVRAGWSQDGDRLTVTIEESRTCNSVRHIPVLRIERVERRTARGAMWFEYGLGAAAMTTGLIGLIRPEWFSQASVTTETGQVLEDKTTGYRIGGIFTAIGTLFLVAAVIDTVRTRDEVRYADAYQREVGGVVQCMDPLAPMQGQTVELLVGKWSTVEPTDDGGGARFLLPGVEDLPEDARKVIEATAAWDAAKAAEDEAVRKAAEEEAARVAAEAEAAKKKGRKKGAKATAAGAGTTASGSGEPTGASGNEAAAAAGDLGPRPEPMVVKGVLRLDNKRALAVSFVVPYADAKATGYEGQGEMDPGPSGGPAPRKSKPLSAEGDENDSAPRSGDASSKGAGKPADTGKTDAGKSGEPTIKLGGSGTSKTSTSSTSKTGEPTIKLGGSGKSGTNKTGEVP